ncbi:zinc finger BED domain-containing protein 5-like [Palaemon carinicauda]|uniref:zinc finger BED domain-containing protein 5-like n=1 Tax=Palaemon carinicauda TaxID=392227 RepID=UPI0035B5E699
MDFFKAKVVGVNSRRLDSSGLLQNKNLAAIEASYTVALRIAHAKKTHTIAENLIFPCTKDIVRLMIGLEAVNKLSPLSVSNNTIKRRITDMSEAILCQIIQELKETPTGLFSIQLDETTDVTNFSQLLVYVRYYKNEKIKEDFLFCKLLLTSTTAVDIFNLIDDFFKEHSIEWEKLCGVCTDGAPAMLGCKSGFQSLVKKVSPEVIGTHCMIHRQVLATKMLPEPFKEVLNQVIKAVNVVKSRPLATWLFKILCEDMGSSYEALLFHTEVRWLSKGKALKRFFYLRGQLQIFLASQNPSEYESLFTNEFTLCKLAYLVDIFEIFNSINTGLQGKESMIISLSEKISSFKMKLELWITKINQKKLYMFPTLAQFVEEAANEINIDDLYGLIQEHLENLTVQIRSYFPDECCKSFSLTINPFNASVTDVPEAAEEEFIDLKINFEAKSWFGELQLQEFWAKSFQKFPVISEIAIRNLLPFPTTYLCEAAFSQLLILKNKYRNQLNVEDDLRCAISTKEPRIELLAKKLQYQPSH